MSTSSAFSSVEAPKLVLFYFIISHIHSFGTGSYTILVLFFFMKKQIFGALSIVYEGRKNSYEAFLNKTAPFGSLVC
jgi:hypothetical protein